MIRKIKSPGFTLIEMIIVITLLSIISVVFGGILMNSYQTFSTAQSASDTDWQGFIALERIANDIHTIRSASDITTVSASQLAFTNINGTSVQYTLSSGSLLRNSQPLAKGIQSLSFSYLDKNGLTTATPSAVRFITFTVSATQGGLTQSFTTMSATRGMV
jgi:prepilin-type N-terminal cleavage/methylation domain-containing protein